MNYTEPLLNQINRFLMSLGFGFVLCVLYLVIKFFRMTAGEKKSVYIFFDILFGVVATVLSFFFMLIYNNGQVRLNLVVGQFIGGSMLYLILKRYLTVPMKLASGMLRRCVAVVFLPLVLYLKAFPNFIKGLVLRIRDKREGKKSAIADSREEKGENEAGKREKIINKMKNIIKIPLKNSHK